MQGALVQVSHTSTSESSLQGICVSESLILTIDTYGWTYARRNNANLSMKECKQKCPSIYPYYRIHISTHIYLMSYDICANIEQRAKYMQSFFCQPSCATSTPMLHFLSSLRWFHRPNYVCMYVCIYVSMYLCICVSMYLHIYLSVYYYDLFSCISTYLYICKFIYVYIYHDLYIQLMCAPIFAYW